MATGLFICWTGGLWNHNSLTSNIFYTMLQNYFLLALRTLYRDRTYAAINLAGLALAFGAVLLIVGYIRYELSFDRHFPTADRVYQLLMEDRRLEPERRKISVPVPLGQTLTEEFSDVEAATPLSSWQLQVKVADKPMKLKAVSVRADFFKVFGLRAIQGDIASALSDKQHIVLAQSAARNFFPEGNPLGKVIERVNYDATITPMTVTAVVEDLPANTHFSFDVLVQAQPIKETLSFKAYSGGSQYILLRKGSSIANLERQMSDFGKKYGLEDKSGPVNIRSIRFLPLTDIRLNSGKIEDQRYQVSDVRFVYIYGIIALLILLIASVNYINLTTARSFQRVREVGMRKVLGAGKTRIVLQFMGESFLLFCLSLPFAVVLAYLFWPAFGNLLQIAEDRSFLLNVPNIVALCVVAVVSAAISGLYPAVVLSRMQPVEVFRQKIGGFRFSFLFRKTLIIFQFCIAVLLMNITVLVYKQLQFLSNRSMGFDESFLLVVPDVNRTQATAFKQMLLSLPAVESVSYGGGVSIGKGYGGSGSMSDPADTTKSMNFGFVDADFDFLKTLKLELLSGRYFSEEYGSDLVNYSKLARESSDPDEGKRLIKSTPIVVTESLATHLNITKTDTSLYLGALQGTIIGIVKDFRATSFKEEGPFIVLRGSQSASGEAFIRIASTAVPATLQAIRQAWESVFPNVPFEYSFADDLVEQIYGHEKRLASLFTVFAVLAITLSVMGLFSLLALIVKQRTKEIGIRKVVGASALDISALFTKDFVILILFAIVIATPVAWWGITRWLEDYAYRTELSGWIFGLTAVSIMAVSLLIINLQVMRSSDMNPVESLRAE